jgi:hypothetical protein
MELNVTGPRTPSEEKRAPLLRLGFIREVQVAELMVDKHLRRSVDEALEATNRVAPQANGGTQLSADDVLRFEGGFENLPFIYLSHLFEQQLATVVRDLGDPQFRFQGYLDLLHGVFEHLRIDVTFLPAWRAIEKLKLRETANVVKHVDARDTERLGGEQREAWTYTARTNAAMRRFHEQHPQPVTNALSDEGFRRPDGDFNLCCKAVIAFWKEFFDIYEGKKTRPKYLRDEVFEKRGEIIAACNKHGASNVRVFGSVARGDAGPASDVDFLVDYAKGTPFRAEMDLQAELESLLGRKVDVGSPDTLKPHHRDRILKEAVPL